MIPESLFRTSPVITRYPEPVLTSKDVPYDSNLTFNAGVVKENGRYIMLFRTDYGGTREQFEKERRNVAGTNSGLAFSDDGIHWQPDLAYWGNSRLVLSCRDVPFCNDKIGPGAPPLKTDAGWLVIFHSVDVDPARGKNGWEDAWRKRYVIGVMLLDLEDPSRVIGLCKVPLMAPEGPEEQIEGFRTNALFPCGMILEDDQTVRIYYSASDTVVRLATAKLDDLISLCTEKP